MEQILLETMLGHMGNNEAIDDSHHGFTKGKLCLIYFMAFYSWMRALVDKGRVTVIIYPDLHKAFDSDPQNICQTLDCRAMGVTDGPLTQWIRIGLNSCTEGPESFQCPAEEQSWVASLQDENWDHHWLTKGAFYMKILACGVPGNTPKLCLPMWRGVLCRVCSSDSPSQDCPCVLMTPWPSGLVWVASLISSSMPTGPTCPVRAILCHQWQLLDTGCCLIRVSFQNLRMRKSPVEFAFPRVWVDTSLFEQITVTKGNLWTLEAPCICSMIILPSSRFFFFLYD